jgi:hypothetical protein
MSLDTSKLGHHWTPEVDNIYDNSWIDWIRTTVDSPFVKPKVVVAKFKFNDIDQLKTLNTNILYPDEEEVRIKDNKQPISYKIYDLDEFREKSIIKWRKEE